MTFFFLRSRLHALREKLKHTLHWANGIRTPTITAPRRFRYQLSRCPLFTPIFFRYVSLRHWFTIFILARSAEKYWLFAHARDEITGHLLASALIFKMITWAFRRFAMALIFTARLAAIDDGGE